MDLLTILDRIEINFFCRLKIKPQWSISEIKKEFGRAMSDVLILTHSRVMKDAKEAKDGP